MTKTVEYRVRPVTRYHVTRFENEDHENGRCSGGCESLGEFDNESQANKVAKALAYLEGKLHIGVKPSEFEEIKDIITTFSDKEK